MHWKKCWSPVEVIGPVKRLRSNHLEDPEENNMLRIPLTIFLSLFVNAALAEKDLSPASWPDGVLQAYHDQMMGEPGLAAKLKATSAGFETHGREGIVATTSGPLAVQAGIETLRQGGTAMDAALTVALAQVVLHAGGATSFAGQLLVVYFDSANKNVEALNASYATVLGEDDPLTIPVYGNPSGRAVLTPGFMAGVEEAHGRYGALSFSSLFEPAIYFAKEGFPVSAGFRGLLENRKQVVTRLPSGRAIFLNDDGEFPAIGSTFRQPVVAALLSNVATQGADYMYKGPWAEKFVTAVRKHEGKISKQDLADYRPDWNQPLHANINGHDVYGGGGLLEVLRLAEIAGMGESQHYSQDAKQTYEMIKISRVGQVLGPNLAGDSLSPEIINKALPDISLEPSLRYTDENAAKVYQAMSTPAWAEIEQKADVLAIEQAKTVAKLIAGFGERKKEEPEIDENARPDHTAGIVVVDSKGNMAALVHSVTSAIWGELGLFVDGVSVVDPGAFSQFNINRIGPGQKLLESSPGCPAIALRDGVATAGCGAVGASYDTFAHQGLVNLLLYELPHQEAALQPMFRKNWPPGVPLRQPQGEGEFEADIIKAVRDLGIDITSVEDPDQATHGSVFVGAGTARSGQLEGGITSGTHAKYILDSTGLIQGY